MFTQGKMFLFFLLSVREACSHAWAEEGFFSFLFSFFKLHMLHMAPGGRGGGRRGLRVWLAASWQLSWISLNTLKLPASRCVTLGLFLRHKVYSTSLSLKAPTGHPFSNSIRRQTGYFSDRPRGWGGRRGGEGGTLMNSLTQEEFSGRFFQPQLNLLSKQMKAATSGTRRLDTGVTDCVQTNWTELS